MNETLLHALRTEQPQQETPETSDENVWQSPGWAVVETALAGDAGRTDLVYVHRKGGT
ncbi:hypothetical protein [Streptomyces guryensis]|uniref:Uncharacterized protein n=1 Tax=Streptomyces guryensis TaxID=2886947 RepID=A0A9Q3VTP2_9ACTN|nr:hypothetical protein [Streptomyces guryensis]MCD9877208.1 hypothetical protein [Streptomyces guryensis]